MKYGHWMCGCNFSVSQSNALHIKITEADKDENEGTIAFTIVSLTHSCCSFQLDVLSASVCVFNRFWSKLFKRVEIGPTVYFGLKYIHRRS